MANETQKSPKYNCIPKQVRRKDFNRYILPHLAKRVKGPKPKLSFYKIFNYILYVLHTGIQWDQLRTRRNELHWSNVYKWHNRWSKDGTFRSDLYFRLNVIPLHTPPLRERVEDIPLLINFLIQKFSDEYVDAVPKQVTQRAMSALCRYDWPGNVRQLENYLHRIYVLSENTSIDLDELPPEILDTSLPTTDFEIDIPESGVALDEIIKEYVCAALAKTNGTQTKAAELLGISRRQLQHRMQSYGLQSQDFREDE